MEEKHIELTSESNNWKSNVGYPGMNNDPGPGLAGIDSTVVWSEGWYWEAAPRYPRVEVGTRDFTAVATRASRSLGHQHPFGGIYQPYCAAINIFLFATQKWQ